MDIGDMVGGGINQIVTFCQTYPLAALLFVGLIIVVIKIKG